MTTQPRQTALSLSRQSRTHPVVTQAAEMSVKIIDASQLCGAIAERWSTMRSQNPRLQSPYFDIEFTKAVARVRNDVEIAVIENADQQVIGFLPYQRVGPNQAEPVGGLLNDVHGSITGSDLHQVDLMSTVMQSAGLRSYRFHALLKADPAMETYEFSELESHFIDMRGGWLDYQHWSGRQSSLLKRQGQKTRALEREVGPIRLEFDCTSFDALESLIALKRAKYRRTKTFDILSVDWASNLLREIATVDKPGFKGLLSTLYAGDHLVAAHFGMLTENILHYWFPVFDPRFAKYSPGTELLLRVAQTAEINGIDKVDLGYGDDLYKFRFCNGHETVSCGKIVFNRLAFRLAKQQYQIRQSLKSIPMKPLAKTMLRGVFPGFGQWNFK